MIKSVIEGEAESVIVVEITGVVRQYRTVIHLAEHAVEDKRSAQKEIESGSLPFPSRLQARHRLGAADPRRLIDAGIASANRAVLLLGWAIPQSVGPVAAEFAHATGISPERSLPSIVVS